MKKGILSLIAVILVLSFYQTVKLDESIKHDAPALQDQGEVYKPQESVINNEPIRPDSLKEDPEKAEPKNLAPPKAVENVKVTAYASCDSIPKGIKNYKKIRRRNGTGTGITKSGEKVNGEVTLVSGKKIRKNIAAADLRYYPIGTLFYVPEIDKTFEVKDIGGSVKGKHHIDIYIDDYVDAIRWGNPKLKVWVMVAQK
ncbi:MAG: 3D domain-containing protein [Parcubacteria group bacterium]